MKIVKLLTFFMILALALNPQDALAKKRQSSSYRRHRHTSVSKSAAYADIVIDADTGEVIHETDSEQLRHPASLTKMMTLYLTFQALDSHRLGLNQYVRVSQNAASQQPSKLGLRAGRRIRVEDAILAVVTESANDAAVVLAEALGGSESAFALQMTHQARELGMTKTRFRNASGLPDPNQVTTARDMAVLGVALLEHFPDYYPYFSEDSFNYGGTVHHNHNHLMERYDGMDGIKTGYIRTSGFNLVASVKREDTRLVAVVFGGKTAVSRDNKMEKLLDKSFDIALGKGGDRLASASDVDLPEKSASVFPSFETSSASQSYSLSATPVSYSLGSANSLHPTAATKAIAGVGAWGIQVGAFSNATAGSRVLTSLIETLPVDLEKATPQVQKVAAGGIVMYRARLMSLSQKTAKDLCGYLSQRGKSCLIVEPS